MKRVLVVGPWVETGGVHTFMQEFVYSFNLKDRWGFKQSDSSRPPRKRSTIMHNFLSSDPKRLIKSLLVTGGNFAKFPLEVRKG